MDIAIGSLNVLWLLGAMVATLAAGQHRIRNHVSKRPRKKVFYVIRMSAQ